MSPAFLPMDTTRQATGPLRVAQRRCAACGGSAAHGTCPECEKNKRQLQARLQVSVPGDAGEREAEQAASDVMIGRGPQVRMLAASAPARRQTQPTVETDAVASPADGHVDSALASNGQALDGYTRSFMESRFSRDFSQVRIHADQSAVVSAGALHAQAYTIGRDIVFNRGMYSPHSAQGRHLLAHELAHVIQQRDGDELIQREMYYGGGYPQVKYKDSSAEVKAAQAGKWHPATVDMKATADGSGGGQPVSSFDAFLTAIEAKTPKSITRLNLIGHSNSRVFSFGGKITADNVEFDEKASLYGQALTDNAARIAKLKDRFAPDAKIVLYSCNAGVGKSLLDAMSNAFGVCVEGFTNEVWWCISMGQGGTLLRGRTWAENPNDPIPAEHPKECSMFSADVTTLTPGSRSCEGLPKQVEGGK